MPTFFSSRISTPLHRAATNVAARVVDRLPARVQDQVRLRVRDFRGGAVSRPTGYVIRRVDIEEISVTYEPHPDGKPDPGEVVWLWIPYQENTSIGKDRPAVVVGWVVDVKERSAARVVAVVPLTSKFHAGQVSVGIGSWDNDHRRSYAKVDQLFAVERTMVRREGSSLTKSAFDQVISALT